MTRPCPICAKPATPEFTPFCSDRCRLLDLNRWFTGAYAVPSAELDDADLDDIARLGDEEDLRSKQ